MRIVVYPHDFTIGGSQINAIDLAAGVAAAGHDVIVYGVPGPLVEYVEERGLRFFPARPLKYRPAPSRIAQLAGICLRERIDLIHTYEWSTCLDAYFGAGLILNFPMLCTVLSMSVTPYIPASVPLVMGTEDLGREARNIQDADVWVLEPPIDIHRDHPGIDGSYFRRSYRVAQDDLLVVSVSRFAPDLKLDALVRAIDAADLLASRFPIKLILVGGGPAYDPLKERAQAINAKWGREVIVLPGPLSDPRGAYAAADVVVGMGSSALRALAIGRPVIVQGEKAFSAIFEPRTLDMFVRQGFYGLADGEPGAARLAAQIGELLVDPERRRALGLYGRKVVAHRFSLDRAVQVQLDIYNEVLARPRGRTTADAARAAHKAFMLEVENHDPRRKRDRKSRENALLTAARGALWPPD